MNTITRRRKTAEAEAEAEAWNALHGVGTPVVVTKDDGSEVRTKTRSIAWVLGEHTAVVMLEGIRGGYLLSRVRLAS